jgi:uncharacterized membrane protein YdjX (TVP38/TMEM64 family)
MDRPLATGVIFALIYASFVALSLPVASLLTLLSGFLFGFWLGAALVISSATLGATIIFLIAKTSLGKTLRERAGPLYLKIEDYMKRDAVSYLLFMRLVPLFPFFVVNIVPALFNIPLRTFVLTTFFGIIPGSAVYVFAGQQLGQIDDPGDVFSADIIIAFALLGLFALLPSIYKKIYGRKPPHQVQE